jgi:transposase-like protein
MSQSKFTIKDFKQRYPSDDACLEELMQLRFSDRPTCPNPTCQKVTKFHRVASKPVYECQWCGYQISPMAGTIFHKSPTPLSDWFYIMYLMTATRSGVSAKEVQRQLGVTYKTAWRMCNKIRQAMDEKSILDLRKICQFKPISRISPKLFLVFS